MLRISRFVSAVGAVLLVGLPFAVGSAAPVTVKVGGTGSALGTMKILAEAFRASHPDVQIVVVPALGSSGSIKAVAAGALDIGLSARPLKQEEREQKLVEREIARTPLVIASMRAHAGFKTGEVARIFDGTLKTWPDDSILRPILRPKTDAETTLLHAISPEIERALIAAHARPGMHVAITDQESADAIEQIPGAVGSSTLALILSEQRKLKALPINGVTPSVEALERGDYPWFKPLYFVTGSNLSGPARDFAAFVQSGPGAKILRGNGYLFLK